MQQSHLIVAKGKVGLFGNLYFSISFSFVFTAVFNYSVFNLVFLLSKDALFSRKVKHKIFGEHEAP